MTSMGFVVLSHRGTEQTARLVRTLTRAYDGPQIAVHHDFAQCPFDEPLEGNASFVRPHLRTAWADFSVVEATVLSIADLLGRRDPPDWIHVLSGADYPVRPADEVVRELAACTVNALMEVVPVTEDRSRDDFRFASPRRHLDAVLPLPLPIRTIKYRGTVPGELLRRAQLRHDWRGASRSLWAGRACFAGSQWFSVDATAGALLVEHHARDRRLARHFRWGMFPEESYLQTIVGNAPHLTSAGEHRRYIRWPYQLDGTDASPVDDHQPQQRRWWTRRQFWDFQKSKLSHPAILEPSMLPDIVASGAYFGRKVDPAVNREVLDLLDEHLGIA
ncbi:MAG: beta-1,6-N-acetylglucosaminyltransferase [Acidimicrobiales bacterium]